MNEMHQVATDVAMVKLLINGEFVDSRSAQWRDVVNLTCPRFSGPA